MALKRSYTVPLRREWLKVPKHRRANRAMKALKKFLARHMKGPLETVRVGPYLNEQVWKNGMRNPPGKVLINTEKNADGLILAELQGKPMFEIKKPEEKVEKSAIEEKLEKVIGKKGTKKAKKAAKKAAEADKEKVAKKEIPSAGPAPEEKPASPSDKGAKPASEQPPKKEESPKAEKIVN